MAECITSGAITPATKPLAVAPMKDCSDEAMPRRSGCRSSTSSVTTGTIMAQPKAYKASGSNAQATCGWNKKLAPKLTTALSSMTTKPCRICCLGASLPAMRPLSQAPAMMPAILSTKNQKYWVGSKLRISPRKAGAESTYKNMPLKGTPLARASNKNRGSRPSCQ